MECDESPRHEKTERALNNYSTLLFSSVQSLSHVRLFATPKTTAHQASLSITNSQSLLTLMAIESVMPPNRLSSVVPFSSCLQSFPASGSLQTSQFFTSGGQSIGVSSSVSVLPMNNQDWLYNSQQYSLAEIGKLWSKRQSHSLLFSCSVMFDSVTPWNV